MTVPALKRVWYGSHRSPVLDTSTDSEVLIASLCSYQLLLSPVLWARIVKTGDKSRRYVFYSIKTSEPVEVSRIGACLMRTIPDFFSAGAYTVSDNALYMC